MVSLQWQKECYAEAVLLYACEKWTWNSWNRTWKQLWCGCRETYNICIQDSQKNKWSPDIRYRTLKRTIIKRQSVFFEIVLTCLLSQTIMGKLNSKERESDWEKIPKQAYQVALKRKDNWSHLKCQGSNEKACICLHRI